MTYDMTVSRTGWQPRQWAQKYLFTVLHVAHCDLRDMMSEVSPAGPSQMHSVTLSYRYPHKLYRTVRMLMGGLEL